MTLREYLSKKKLKASAFAEKIGYTPSAVSFWMAGTRFPQPAAIVTIHRATKGWVKAKDWFDEKRAGDEEFARDRT